MSAPAATTVKSIAIIMGSTRQPRVNPQVVDFVSETFDQWKAAQPNTHVEAHIIDLASWNLPMYDEPGVPSQIHHESEYAHEHTKAWSKEMQKHSAFIFVSPQYNWGYPAVLKNAIDYLFFEWSKKPAMIVTYGGHGGTKCAVALREVLNGTGMQPVETMPALTFGSRETLIAAARGKDVHAMGEGSIFRGERDTVTKGINELVSMLDQPSS